MKQLVLAVASIGLLGVAIAPSARADEWNKKTILTVNETIQVPNKVLPPGKYVIKLLDSPSNRHIVQIFDGDETHLLTTILAIPNYRLQPTGKTVFGFWETPPGQPKALRAWFYPGDDYGHQFVYPKPKALELAKANNTPVPSMPADLAPNTTKPAATVKEPHIVAMSKGPLKAQKPTQEEVEIAEVFVRVQAPPPPKVVALKESPAAQAVLPTRLPNTASPLPFIGLIGLLSLGAALGLRFAVARSK